MQRRGPQADRYARALPALPGRRVAPRRRGRCAAWRGGSGRCWGPAAARAASRHPPRCARRARSARSRRSRSPARRGGCRQGAARGPGRRAAARRAAAAPGRRSLAGPPRRGGFRPCRAGRRGCRRRARPARRGRRGPAASGRSRGWAMSRAAWLDGDREHAAGAFHDLGVASGRTRRAPSAVADIASRRSSGRSMRLQVEAEGQRQVGFQRAFVDFVENHRGDAIQARIGLQAADAASPR